MGKKFVPVQIAGRKYPLFLSDIKKVFKCYIKKTPPIPSFGKNDVTTEINTDQDVSFESIVLSEL